jgi:hypothetical protein
LNIIKKSIINIYNAIKIILHILLVLFGLAHILFGLFLLEYNPYGNTAASLSGFPMTKKGLFSRIVFYGYFWGFSSALLVANLRILENKKNALRFYFLTILVGYCYIIFLYPYLGGESSGDYILISIVYSVLFLMGLFFNMEKKIQRIAHDAPSCNKIT